MNHLKNITYKHPNRVLICLLMVVLFNNAKAQTNLVPNPSFEQYINCPSGLREDKPDFWYKPDSRGGAYWNPCNPNYVNGNSGYGYQLAQTDSCFIGMFYRNGGDTRNYFQVKLLDSLKIGKYYYAEYFVNRQAGEMRLACNNQSMLFTKNAVYADTIIYVSFLSANPQITNYGNPIITDTINWVKVSGIFKAQGGEQYLTLGNFKNNAQTPFIIIQPTGYAGAGYFVDDVAVYALDSFNLKAYAGKDTTITIGDSVFIGSLTNGIDSLKWQIQNTGIAIDSTRPGFWVHPLVNTCYVLTQTVNGFTSSDTVCVNVLPLPLKFLKYEVRSTNESPASLRGTKQSVENIWKTANEINVSHFNIQHSLNGRDYVNVGSVKAQNKSSNEYSFIDNQLPITNDQLTIYYRLQSIDKDGRKQYSEVRNIEYRIRNNELRIYPNPAKEFITVECKGVKELLIIDYLGRTVYQQNNITEHQTLNSKQFAKGLYLVKMITANGEVKSEKLIVE